jgi:uncharacterized protein YutE (UPF0331/DUF86 family)
MTPADRFTIAQKVGFIEGSLRELAEYRALSEEAFLADKKSQRAVERLLQTAIEALMDSARLMTVMQGWRGVREDTDALLILARHGIIADTLASRLVNAKKFRNVLVHVYAEVNPREVYRNLQEGTADLQAFAKAMAAWLREHSGDSEL